MTVRRATDAFGYNPLVNCPGKITVFHKTCRFARVVGKAFSLASILYPAFIHLKDKTVFGFFYDRLLVNTGVDSKTKRPLQALQATVFGKL
jgi:hypothetical protein